MYLGGIYIYTEVCANVCASCINLSDEFEVGLGVVSVPYMGIFLFFVSRTTGLGVVSHQILTENALCVGINSRF